MWVVKDSNNRGNLLNFICDDFFDVSDVRAFGLDAEGIFLPSAAASRTK
jgi:hypothetical protein